MPIEHTHYGCKFKCGFKHTTDYYKVYYHENECWFNPKNKTCCTCKHGKRIFNSFDLETGHEYNKRISSFWECSITLRHETLYDQLIEKYPKKEQTMFAYEYAKPAVLCSRWERKNNCKTSETKENN